MLSINATSFEKECRASIVWNNSQLFIDQLEAVNSHQIKLRKLVRSAANQSSGNVAFRSLQRKLSENISRTNVVIEELKLLTSNADSKTLKSASIEALFRLYNGAKVETIMDQHLTPVAKAFVNIFTTSQRANRTLTAIKNLKQNQYDAIRHYMKLAGITNVPIANPNSDITMAEKMCSGI